MTEKFDNNFYNKIYKEKEDVFGKGREDPFVRRSLEYIPEGARILEIGAGQGRNSLYLAGKGFNITATDISETGIAKIREKAKEADIQINTAIESALEAITKENFDVLVATLLLHHIEEKDARKLLELIKEKTNPGGLNILTDFTKTGEFYKNYKNKECLFVEEGELKELYKDWEVLHFKEWESETFTRHLDGTPVTNIASGIIARKKKIL